MMFFPSTYPSSCKPLWKALKFSPRGADRGGGKPTIRKPIRGTFFGCCASAMTAKASSTTTNRIDKTLAFLIAHTIRYVSHGRLVEKVRFTAGRRQVFVD